MGSEIFPTGRGKTNPQTIWTVIVSAPNRYRSLSRERTHMDLEDPNGVSKEDIGLPTSLTEFQT